MFRIVEEFTKYVRPDLGKNIRTPGALTISFGIGVPEGYGIQSSDVGRGIVAKRDLIHRARVVNANPSMFSGYTVEFAKLFAEQWDCTKEHELEEVRF